MTIAARHSQRPLPDYEHWLKHQSIWELKDAANLHLGFSPEKGGMFSEFNELLSKHEDGLILVDSETLWPVTILKGNESKVEWNEVFNHKDECKISLELFIRRKIAVQQIKPILSDDFKDGIYFHPKEIISFFQKNFLNPAPEQLLNALGMSVKQKAQPVSKKELRRFYKVHISTHAEKGIIPSWQDDKKAMMKALGKNPTDKQIKQIRAELAPNAWKKRGRRQTL